MPRIVKLDAFLADGALSAALTAWLAKADPQELAAYAKAEWRQVQTLDAAERQRAEPFPQAAVLEWLKEHQDWSWGHVYCALHGVTLTKDDELKLWSWSHLDRGQISAVPSCSPAEAAEDAKQTLKLPD